MKHYLFLLAGPVVLSLGLFGLVEWLQIPLLTQPQSWSGYGPWSVAFIGVSLLVADVLLPVPSSLIMIMFGALFGSVLGTFLAWAGSVGAGLFAFYLGRRCTPLLERLVPEAEKKRLNSFLERWGAVAVIITRPVPILAETVALLAGTSALSWPRMTWATLLGSFPAAVLYALTGAWAMELDSALAAFGLVSLVAGGFWYIGRRFRRQLTG